MKSLLAVFIIGCIIPRELRGQVIHLKEYNIFINTQKCADTIMEELPGNKKLRIYLQDCMGKMDIEVFLKNKLIEKGAYINSLDTLKSYAIERMLPSSEKKIIVKSYFEPLRNGQWVFFDLKKRSNIIKHYKNGIEMTQR